MVELAVLTPTLTPTLTLTLTLTLPPTLTLTLTRQRLADCVEPALALVGRGRGGHECGQRELRHLFRVRVSVRVRVRVRG